MIDGTRAAQVVAGGSALLRDADFMRGLREQMLSFATLQLGQRAVAEDAVQEALIGALKSIDSFAGKSALRTWVFAILKHKIADALRQRKTTVVASELSTVEGGNDLNLKLFDDKGAWHKQERPAPWGDPEASFREGEFWQVLDICLNDLPANQARVFMMREFIELNTDEICHNTGFSVSNLHVLLHRARLRLRECLENKWFGSGSERC